MLNPNAEENISRFFSFFATINDRITREALVPQLWTCWGFLCRSRGWSLGGCLSLCDGRPVSWTEESEIMKHSDERHCGDTYWADGVEDVDTSVETDTLSLLRTKNNIRSVIGLVNLLKKGESHRLGLFTGLVTAGLFAPLRDEGINTSEHQMLVINIWIWLKISYVDVAVTDGAADGETLSNTHRHC